MLQQGFDFDGNHDPKLVRAFRQFHKDNPQVYALFRRFAFEAINSGREHFGAKMIWERMRWYVRIETNSSDYKLNNNYHAFYVRLFEKDFPQYEGFFRKRKAVADKSEGSLYGD